MKIGEIKIGSNYLILGGSVRGVSVRCDALNSDYNPDHTNAAPYNPNPFRGIIVNNALNNRGLYPGDTMNFGEPRDLPIILDPMFVIGDFLR